MITFNWEIKKNDRGVEFIWWEAIWDGRHDNDIIDCPSYYDVHPFFNTGTYQQEKMIYQMKLEKSGRSKKTNLELMISNPEDPNKKEKIQIPQEEDIEEYNPNNLREIGNIVYCNEVTKAICKMINDKDSLMKNTGNKHPYTYRIKLISFIDWLWD